MLTCISKLHQQKFMRGKKGTFALKLERGCMHSFVLFLRSADLPTRSNAIARVIPLLIAERGVFGGGGGGCRMRDTLEKELQTPVIRF